MSYLLVCNVANPLGISTGVIPGYRITGTSEKEGFLASTIAATGWCGSNRNKGGNGLTIVLDDPMIIERVRLEKVGQDMKKFTSKISLRYALDVSDPLKQYADTNGTVSCFKPGYYLNFIFIS